MPNPVNQECAVRAAEAVAEAVPQITPAEAHKAASVALSAADAYERYEPAGLAGFLDRAARLLEKAYDPARTGSFPDSNTAAHVERTAMFLKLTAVRLRDRA